MQPNKFRLLAPNRTCSKSFTNYRDYKTDLANDFNHRCGYTDCLDFWFGGKDSFHIDHFIPWKKHFQDSPKLKTDYSNLVYSCSYVNILKSDDEGNYLDPCTIDYNQHFYRDSIGRIIPAPNSQKANYMYQKLKLYLERYQIIWILQDLFNKIKILEKIDKKIDGVDHDEIQKLIYENSYMTIQYINYAQEKSFY